MNGWTDDIMLEQMNRRMGGQLDEWLDDLMEGGVQ